MIIESGWQVSTQTRGGRDFLVADGPDGLSVSALAGDGGEAAINRAISLAEDGRKRMAIAIKTKAATRWDDPVL